MNYRYFLFLVPFLFAIASCGGDSDSDTPVPESEPEEEAIITPDLEMLQGTWRALCENTESGSREAQIVFDDASFTSGHLIYSEKNCNGGSGYLTLGAIECVEEGPITMSDGVEAMLLKCIDDRFETSLPGDIEEKRAILLQGTTLYLGNAESLEMDYDEPYFKVTP